MKVKEDEEVEVVEEKKEEWKKRQSSVSGGGGERGGFFSSFFYHVKVQQVPRWFHPEIHVSVKPRARLRPNTTQYNDVTSSRSQRQTFIAARSLDPPENLCKKLQIVQQQQEPASVATTRHP